MDVAQLGFQIDSRQAVSAARNLDQMGAAAGRTQTATERMQAQVQSAVRSFAGIAAGVAVFEAVRRGISAGVREAVAFRSAMAEVGTLLNDVSGLNKQSLALRNLSTLYGTTATAQARAYYQAISAGAKEGAEALEVLNTANRLAIGGVTQVEVALDGLTSVMNAYAESNLSAADIADTLFVGMRAGKTTIGELSGALGQVAPIASSVGVEFNELVSAVSAITTAGVSTSIAVTQVRAALAAILKPTSEASKLAAELGIDFSVAGVRANGFASFLEEVRKKTDGSEAAIATLFGSVEAIGGMLALTGTQAETFGRILEQQGARAGETDRAFEKMAENAEFTFARLGSIIADRMMAIGDAILAGITPAARLLVESIDQIATAIALAFGGRALAAIGAYTAEVLKTISAKSAMLDVERLSAAAGERSAAATLAQARAEEQQIASKMRLVRASVATAEATYAQANATTIAAQKQVEAARSAGALSFALRAVRDAEEKLALATRSRAQAMAALTGLDRAQAGVQAQLAAATNATTAAMTAQTAAVARSAAALTGMQAVMAAVSAGAARAAVALGAVFTALGGWVTVGLAALYGLYQLGSAMVNGSAQAQENAAALDQLSDSMARTRKESELMAAGVTQGSVATASAVQAAIQSIDELQAKTYSTERHLETMGGAVGAAFGVAATGFRLMNEQIDQSSIDEQTESLQRFLSELGGSVATSQNAEQAIQEAVTALQAAGFNTEGLADRLQWLNSMFGQTKAAAEGAAAGMAPFSEETENLLNRLRERTDTIGLAGVALLQYQQTQAVANAEDAKSAEAINAQYDALIQRTIAHDAAAKAQQESSRASEQAARAQARAAEETKRYRLEITQLAARQRMQRSAEGAAFLQNMQQLAATLAGPLAQAQLKYNQQAEEANRLLFEGSISSKDYADAIALYGEELERARAELEANTEEARWLQSILDEFNNTGMSGLVREIGRVGKALETALTPDQREAMLDYLQKLQGAAGEFRQQGLETMVGATQQVLGAIQGLSKEGSKAYKAMEVASHALNVVLAIGAILNQGKGDPYTAFARMAAMAVAVAGLVGSIGANFGGSSGMTDTAAERQATQGRGSVLGDPEAQSQSIANATAITADATSELVGINRGMLNALTALQGGLDRAGGMLARGAGNAPFTEIGGSFSFRDNFLGGALSFLPLDPLGILGGSSQITDQGIALGGGGLDDLNVMGFQEQQFRRWRFGSRRTREELVGVSEELESQFALVVSSIVETVRQGALALGMLPDEVEAALSAFRLEEIRISLKDLTAEEQQAELLAVFSTIFDNLAGSVVPYIAQFQRVGEGLGETLVRVATSVQVTQEAMTRLGFSLGELDPQTFAEISVNLIDMVGGIEEFASAMRSFVGNFAPEAHQLAIAQDDLTRAFAAVGLTVPETRDGMWALMQSLDATTVAGQEQIATLLRLAGVADSYYTILERQVDTELQDRIDHLEALLDANRAYYDFAEDIARQFAQSLGSDLTTSLIDVERTYRRNVATAHDLARAAGMAGAAERDLARIELIAARQRVEAMRLTEESARGLAGELGLTELSQLDAQISAFEAASQGIQSAVGGVSDAFDAAAQRAKETMDLLIGDLSPLRDAEKLQIALQGLQAGTATADQVLQIGRRLYGSGNDYRQLFNQVLAMRPASQGGGDFGGGGVSGPAPVSPELQALLTRRDEIMAAQAAQLARTNALTLVEQIGELAHLQEVSFEEVAAGLGIDLRGLAEILQVDDETLNAMLVRQAEESAELQEAVLEMPDLFADAVEPITDELVALRELVADLIVAVQDVVRNTGDTAAATGATATTTANRDLIETSSAPRSSRIGLGTAGTGSFGPGGRSGSGLVPAGL